ncbi:hypothetical protein MUP29_00470, partial [bacterium]|nr:hypothetical protein [bacterium]
MSVHYPRSKQALRTALAAAALAILASGVLQSAAQAFGDSSRTLLFKEEFNTLEKWKPLKFKNIENMSSYTLDQQRDGESFVKAQSSSS